MTACNRGSAQLPFIGRKVLEVIVTSVQEAVEAEQGGADRLEIVRSLDQGGLTPPFALVREITSAVAVPVRVMLRENDSMSLTLSSTGEPDPDELARLMNAASQFSQLPIDGLVVGFVRNGKVDESALLQILSAAPEVSVTFHRAFEALRCPLTALTTLQSFAQIDRILVRVREDGWGISLAEVGAWQRIVTPQIRFIAGMGLDRTLLHSLRQEPDLSEIHAGRGARDPETTFGIVSRTKVAQLKSALL